MAELKPCPFCGATPIIERRDGDSDDRSLILRVDSRAAEGSK